MTAPAMTEAEMVTALMRDYDVPRDRAVAMVAASRGEATRDDGYKLATEKRYFSERELLADGIRLLAVRPATEADIQIELLARLVGPSLKGQPRQQGVGLAGAYPEISLVYAINPNAGATSKRAAGRAKAMGLLADMPDLHLPVMRGPFLSLYVELKRPGETMRPGQRAMAARLREQGHCVLEIHSVDDGVNAFVGYMELPPNRPAARAVSGKNAPFKGTLVERIQQWRAQLHDLLQPARGK